MTRAHLVRDSDVRMCRLRELWFCGALPGAASALLALGACTGEIGGAFIDPGGADGAPSAPVVADAGVPDADPGCQPGWDRPGVCPPRGVHDGPVEIELVSHIESAPIYYTLDGSAPAPEAGTRYTGPFVIEGQAQEPGGGGEPARPFRGAVTLRAAVFPEVAAPSVEVVHSYVFPEVVVTQPAAPLGYPGQWADNPRGADYEMDPDVLVDAAARAAAADALRSLPTVSVVMDHDDLWSEDRGIYLNPEQEGVDWERPASFEILLADGTSHQVRCGVRIQGGSSTQNWKVDKLSMRVLFKSAYGSSKLIYPLFPGSPVFAFDTLVLDAHMNLTFVHPDHGQRIRSQYVRDLYTADLQRAAGGLAPHGRFVHYYLNGLYWGLYELHERPDHSFAAAYQGGDKEEYDALRHDIGRLINGDAGAWNAMFEILRRPGGLADDDSYRDLQAYLDIPDFIDYMLVNFYAGNDDWPHHNWYAARRRVEDAGFRFFSWDAEHVLKSLSHDETTEDDPGSPGEIFQALRASPAFLVALDARADELFGPGGVFHVNPERPGYDPARPEDNAPAHLYMQRIEEIRAAMLAESARWGDNRRPDQPYTVADWEAELDWLLTTYFPQRSDIVRAQLPRP